MADIHIDEFHHDCTKALVMVYNAFPRLITLYVDDLISDSGTDEFGIPTRRHKACFDALVWLGEENYIRYQDRVHQNALDQVTLTEKCFLRMNMPSSHLMPKSHLPVALANKRRTIVWQFREALKESSSDKINSAFVDFLSR